MRIRHQVPLEKSVMLRDAPQTSWLMQNVHGKSKNLPDPDTFALDSLLLVFITQRMLALKFSSLVFNAIISSGSSLVPADILYTSSCPSFCLASASWRKVSVVFAVGRSESSK